MPTLTQDLLKELFHYDPESGVVTRKQQYKNGPKVGSIVGCKKPNGYVMAIINRNEYRIHHLIYVYMTGEWPVHYKSEIDHINGDGYDNRWINLRCVPHSENMKNLKRPSRNTTGHIGIWRDKARGKWVAEISVKYRKKHLGRYENIEDAVQARKAAERKYGFHPNHGRLQ